MLEERCESVGTSVEVTPTSLPCLVDNVPNEEHWADVHEWIKVSPLNSDSDHIDVIGLECKVGTPCINSTKQLVPVAPALPDPAGSINKYIHLSRTGLLDHGACLCLSPIYKKVYCVHNSLIQGANSKKETLVGSYTHANNPAALCGSRLEYMPFVDKSCTLASIYSTVRGTGLPNVLRAQVPIETGLQISAWEEISTGHEDDTWLIECLKYGFPIQYIGGPINNNSTNHQSAINNTSHVQDYIQVESQYKAMSGPFTAPPFTPWCNISPLMTRDKSTPGKKRVIVDLSYPSGSSVNDMINKNSFMGFKLAHKLPTVQTAIYMAARHNFKVKIASIDIERAYRNFPVCPLDWPLLVIKHRGQFYVDQALPFGTRMSSLYMQRLATFILRHLATRGIVGLFFLDDLLIIHPEAEDPYLQFSEAMECFHRLGLPLSYKKLVDPTSSLVWLGIRIDISTRTISIPQEKLNKFIALIKSLMPATHISKVALMSLLGKVNHFSQVIKPARLFMARLLATLRGSYTMLSVPLDEEAKADMRWMLRYMLSCNTRSMMDPPPPDMRIFADSCLQGGGAHTDTHYYSLQYSSAITSHHHISQLEALNCLVALRSLGNKKLNKHIEICCDNSATIMVFTHHRGRDRVMNAICRALWYWSYSSSIHLSFTHIPGKDMILSDALSRRAIDPQLHALASTIIQKKNLSEIKTAPRATDYSDFL